MNTVEKNMNENENKLVKVVTIYNQLDTLFKATDFVCNNENFIKAEIVAVTAPDGAIKYNVQVLCKL